MTQTLIVILIVAVVVILAVALIVGLTRRSRLRPLPAESRARFAQTWDEIESRFIDDPRAAVQEADRLAVMILTERGATMPDGRDVPEYLQQARHAASSDEGRQGTEGMRKAMLHYKRIVDDAIGPKEQREMSRREVA